MSFQTIKWKCEWSEKREQKGKRRERMTTTNYKCRGGAPDAITSSLNIIAVVVVVFVVVVVVVVVV